MLYSFDSPVSGATRRAVRLDSSAIFLRSYLFPSTLNSMKDAPATKADIELLMKSIDRLYEACERWKQETVDETNRHFDVVVEQLVDDFNGATRDELQLLKDRQSRFGRRLLQIEHQLA